MLFRSAANNIALELFRDFPDEAMNYLNEANQWAKEISYQEGLSKNLWIQGRTKALNDKMGSMSLFEKALDIAKKSNYQEGICNAQTNIAILYTDLSQYGKSDSLFNEIIPIAEKLNDHTILSSIYTNMSRNPEREGKYFEAIDLLLKGAIYAQASNNLLLEGNAYTSIGRCF